jgi:hypothetical protein
MLLEEIDMFDAKPGQAGITRSADVLRMAGDNATPIVQSLNSEFRRHDHILTPSDDGPANQLLIDEGSV